MSLHQPRQSLETLVLCFCVNTVASIVGTWREHVLEQVVSINAWEFIVFAAFPPGIYCVW